MSEFAIKVENLVKRYGSNYALNDVSFEIREGEIIGLLGPNGAGKSTTMNILTGYLAPTSGRAEICGIDVRENPIEAKKLIGFLPEQPPVYPDLTVWEYLNFVYELKGCTLPREAHLADAMSAVKLGDVKNRLIRNLSKGYKQRVGIAATVIGDPKVLIFDEPTVGLDPKQILEVRSLLRALAKNHTVILSTHILAEVQSVCERLLIINRGKLIADGKTEDLTKTITDGYCYEAKIIGPQSDITAEIKRLPGVRDISVGDSRDADAISYVIESNSGFDIRRPLFTLCAERGWPMIGLAPVGTDLESVFIRLVDRSEAAERSAARKAH